MIWPGIALAIAFIVFFCWALEKCIPEERQEFDDCDESPQGAD